MRAQRKKYPIIALFLTEIIPQTLPAVFVFVAIDAKIFPIGAIRRIILGIAVLMVHR